MSSRKSAIIVANGIPLTAIPRITSASPCDNAISLKAPETYLKRVEFPPKLFQFIKKSTGASGFSSVGFWRVNHLAVSILTLSSSAISPVVKPCCLSS